MADLICTADGNLTAAATWGLVDTTSKNVSTNTSTTTLGTGNSDSQTFTPGAITVDGIALRLASRAAGSPTNTLTVTLRNSTDATDAATVTINVSDLPPCSTSDIDGGWFFAKFASPVLLTAGKAYLVRLSLSATSTAVLIYRDATAANHQRLLRTTTTQAPTTGDDMFIMAEISAGGSVATRTVTMDSTAATDYGFGNTAILAPAFAISKGGTLTYGTSASTNYVLRISGHMVVYSGGTLNIGTTGTPIPRTSTAVLEFDSSNTAITNGAFGLSLRNLATFTAQGLSRTVGKNIYYCLLNTDEAVAQTTLGVDTDTGWLSGDEIGIASTTRLRGEAESRTLNADAGASSLVVTAGLTNAHSGTAPTQAEVILLTRNVKIRSVSSTNPGYIWAHDTSSVDIDWTEFRYMGGSGTVAGMICNTTGTGSLSIQYCSCRDAIGYWFYADQSDSNNFTFQYNVAYTTGGASSNIGVRVSATSGTNWTVADNVVVSAGASTDIFYLDDLGGTVARNRASGGSGGFRIDHDDAAFGVFEDNLAHSNAGVGFLWAANTCNRRTLSNLTAWRNNGIGFQIASSTGSGLPWREVKFSGVTAFGNGVSNITLAGYFDKCRGLNWSVYGEASYSVTNGVLWSGGANRAAEWRWDNSSFSVHTNDFNFNSAATRFLFEFWDCSFASGTEWANTGSITAGSAIRSTRHDGTATRMKTLFFEGTVEDEQTIFNTAAPSAKVTPNAVATSAFRFEGVRAYAPVNNGSTVTFSVRVRKTAAYDGSAPRLVVKMNPAIGIDADAVLDTLTVAADTWEELTGSCAAASADGVVEAVVDCDYGTGGNIYVDDFTVV